MIFSCPMKMFLPWCFFVFTLFIANTLIADPSFPIKVSPSGRHLVDSLNQPFIIHADTPWSLIVQVSFEQAQAYLEDRKTKGFNTLILNLIEHEYSDQAPNNYYNTSPFTTPGDLSTPNPAYFDHAARVIEAAQQKGFLVLMTPSYFGYNGGSSGWWQEITNNGPTKCRSYGSFLGNRFNNFPNIIWLLGGDYSPPAGSTGELNAVQMAEGIKSTDRADRLFTYHGVRRTNAIDQIAFNPYVSINAVYSPPTEIYQRCLTANSTSSLPTFIIEAYYENEHGMTPYSLRQQAYWAVTSCTSGQAFGNAPIWYFNARNAQAFADNQTVTWNTALNWRGSLEQQILKNILDRFQAFGLMPDTNHLLVTSGYGSYGSTSYATTGIANDNSFSMTYLPTSSTITFNLGWFSKQVYLYWFDPTNGSLTSITGSPFSNSGNQLITSPGNNHSGSTDWVLIGSILDRLNNTKPNSPNNLRAE
jgi:Protein of unknown function (DUF4038)/Putative collagen-binding domain of a collagenase